MACSGIRGLVVGFPCLVVCSVGSTVFIVEELLEYHIVFGGFSDCGVIFTELISLFGVAGLFPIGLIILVLYFSSVACVVTLFVTHISDLSLVVSKLSFRFCYLGFGKDFRSLQRLFHVEFCEEVGNRVSGIVCCFLEFLVSRVVIRKWLPSGQNYESLLAGCRQTSRRHPLEVFCQQLAVECVMLLGMELCSLKCVDESGKLELQVGFPIVSWDFCSWVVDEVFLNFFGECDVPRSPEDARVSNQRVEDIDLVYYIAFDLLDLDEGLFGRIEVTLCCSRTGDAVSSRGIFPLFSCDIARAWLVGLLSLFVSKSLSGSSSFPPPGL
ncbi:hypothetical protein YC2023_108993 [Brassica napus]